jgi:hypothetical protein
MTTTARLTNKAIKAAAIALLVELTDVALDKLGLPPDRFVVVRKALKTGVGTVGNSLLARCLTRLGG